MNNRGFWKKALPHSTCGLVRHLVGTSNSWTSAAISRNPYLFFEKFFSEKDRDPRPPRIFHSCYIQAHPTLHFSNPPCRPLFFSLHHATITSSLFHPFC
jgi:hypothetical protein